MINFNAILLSYLPMTDKRLPRIKLEAPRFKQRLYIPYDMNTEDNIVTQGITYLEKLGFSIEAMAMNNDGFILMSSTFKPLRE